MWAGCLGPGPAMRPDSVPQPGWYPFNRPTKGWNSWVGCVTHRGIEPQWVGAVSRCLNHSTTTPLSVPDAQPVKKLPQGRVIRQSIALTEPVRKCQVSTLAKLLVESYASRGVSRGQNRGCRMKKTPALQERIKTPACIYFSESPESVVSRKTISSRQGLMRREFSHEVCHDILQRISVSVAECLRSGHWEQAVPGSIPHG